MTSYLALVNYDGNFLYIYFEKTVQTIGRLVDNEDNS